MNDIMAAEQEISVSIENTAKAVGSGSLEVFATPALGALAESTACRLIEGRLKDGEATVGAVLNIKHLAPTPVGLTVKCVCRLVAEDGRRLCFEMELFDRCGKVAEVYHERFVVASDKFMKKALRGEDEHEKG